MHDDTLVYKTFFLLCLSIHFPAKGLANILKSENTENSIPILIALALSSRAYNWNRY